MFAIGGGTLMSTPMLWDEGSVVILSIDDNVDNGGGLEGLESKSYKEFMNGCGEV